MQIKIDFRENALLQQINTLILMIPQFKSIHVQTENLPIGDIIVSNEQEDIIIIERKTVNDLLASIKDGRYDEQSYRLHGLKNHNHNIFYLIEGDINRSNKFKTTNPMEKMTAYSAMFSLNYFKGFSVIRSGSIEETAFMVCNMVYKLEKDATKTAFYPNKPPLSSTIKDVSMEKEEEKKECNTMNEPKVEESNEKEYVNVIKKVKKENITPNNIGEIMLCQIPGISSVTALAIMEKYKNISTLIKELEVNNESMKDLSYTNEKGQTRKINKTCIANIVTFLLKK